MADQELLGRGAVIFYVWQLIVDHVISDPRHACSSSGSKVKQEDDETIIILTHDFEYCWAFSTFSPHATFSALSTLLIFEGSRILGYSGPLVNSIWVSDFNELDFIPFHPLPPPICRALIRYFRTRAMPFLTKWGCGN